MAAQYESIQQRRVPTDGYYMYSDRDSNDSEKESLIPDHDHGIETSYKDGLKKGKGGVRCFVYVLAAFSAIGGFLFGYDTGVVSGAMIKVRVKFHLDSTMQEAIVSATIGAAALAAGAAGPLTDTIGRKPTLIISSGTYPSLPVSPSIQIMLEDGDWDERLPLSRKIPHIGAVLCPELRP